VKNISWWRGIALTAMAVLMLGVAVAKTGEDGSKTANWWEDDVWSNPDRGFNWYPPDKPKPKRDEKSKEQKRPDIRSITDIEELEKEVKVLRSKAVMQPTEANVYAYMAAQEYVMSKAAMFSDVARRVVWQNPDIDSNARQPIATYSATAKRERTVVQRRTVMGDLSKTHGLVFFFRSDCPFCHDFAPVVKSLSDQYGIEVMPVSMDGQGIAEFPRPRVDNGISTFVSNGAGVQTVPALYLVSNDQKTVTLVGVGALSIDEVTERIRVLTSTKPGEELGVR
jgi:conjugal transfer pilus assembly protein TraF